MARNVFSDTNLSYGSWEAIQIGAHYHLHILHKSMWVRVRSTYYILQKIFWDKVLFQQSISMPRHLSHNLRVVAECFNCVFNMIFDTSILLHWLFVQLWSEERMRSWQLLWWWCEIGYFLNCLFHCWEICHFLLVPFVVERFVTFCWYRLLLRDLSLFVEIFNVDIFLNECLWYDKFWGPSRRVVTLLISLHTYAWLEMVVNIKQFVSVAVNRRMAAWGPCIILTQHYPANITISF